MQEKDGIMLDVRLIGEMVENKIKVRCVCVCVCACSVLAIGYH